MLAACDIDLNHCVNPESFCFRMAALDACSVGNCKRIKQPWCKEQTSDLVNVYQLLV